MKNTEEMKINAGAGYSLHVEGPAGLSEVFHAVQRKTAASGEALVNNVLAHAPGHIVKVARYNAGKLNDGLDGQAAVQVFNEQGRATLKVHYKHGQPTDTATEAAMTQLDNDGNVLVQSHYINGKLNDTATEAAVIRNESNGTVVHEHFRDGYHNDTADGQPAVQVFRDGALVRAERFTDGQVNDGPNGEPANQHFDKNGKATLTENFSHGHLTKTSASGFKHFVKTKVLRQRPKY